jgi:hypothetical protein
LIRHVQFDLGQRAIFEEINEYTDYQPKWGLDKTALGGDCHLERGLLWHLSLNRGEAINAAWLVIAPLCLLHCPSLLRPVHRRLSGGE